MEFPQDTLDRLRATLQARFDVAPDRVRVVWAPYRICPLGAHVDHQLGTVTALAIDRGVHLAFAPSGSAEVRLASLAYPGEVCFRVDQAPPMRVGDWGNYPRGAAWALHRKTPLTQGLLGVTSGELAEMGLSSSAAIGVACLLALEEVNGLRCTPAENIRLDQVLENEYLGLHNGILDQAAILCSRRDHLTVIDCRAFAEPARADQAIRVIPAPATLPPWAVLVAFSGLTKAVITTDYNRRVAECMEAARVLLQAAGRPLAAARLGLVAREEFLAHRFLLTGAAARRAEHFFSEGERVQRGVAAWQRGDLAALGQLMRESGQSSIRNYECGCPALVDLCELLNRTPGVYGARFSGAGFRGCCVALVEPEAAARALPELARAYAARQPELAAQARFFLCSSSDGACLR